TVSAGTAVTFTGSASDTEDGDLSGTIEWSSDLDGSLGTGASVGATLSLGTHTITASVTDTQGQTSTSSISLSVTGDPSVSITSPTDGTTVDEGTTVTLTGSASDPEDGDLSASIVWSSDLDGALGTGGSVDATLSVGTHAVTAAVTDSDSRTASTSITVIVNAAPSVSITAPSDGATLDAGSTTTFSGTASDPEDGDLTASIAWSSSLDGTLGTGGTVDAVLSEGTHTITATVTDPDGASGSASIEVVVEPPGVVTVSATDDTAVEDEASSGTFTVSRTGSTTLAVTVNYTIGGTATAGADYSALAGDVTIEAGQASATVVVDPVADGPVEDPETVILTLAAGDYTIGDPSTATVTITDASAPATLINGENHTATIGAPGELHTWTFDAAAGDFIAVNIGEVGTGTDFVPWIRLMSPSGSLVTGDFGSLAAQVNVANAPETGTYTVIVGSNDSGQDGTGDYRLTLVHVPGTFVVPTGDEGGSLTNGDNHTGSIHVGDFDQWTFDATAGDWISVNIGELADGTGFVPWIRLVSPTGASITGDFGGVAAQFTVPNAPETGTYTVVVGTNDSGRDGSGDYQLTLARVPGTSVVPTGDEGGALTNGENHTGSIHLGDLDQWTFDATAGDWISVNIGELANGTGFVPWIRLISPTGASITGSSGGLAAQLTVQNAPETGTYTVVVGTNDSGQDGTGDYQLTLAKVPGTFVVPSGDDGGALTNGENHTGSIHLGDLDQWTFEATAGDWISVNIGELADGTGFVPWIRLISPSGALVAGDFGSIAAQVTDQNAAETGTYTVVVGTNDSGREGTGDYQLTLARVPGSFVVPTGDEGGSITNGGNHTGSIHLGDLDQWTFEASAGDWISVNIGELADGTGFVPWVRLISPTGGLVAGDFGGLAAQLTVSSAPATGTYTLVVGTNDSGRDGTGDYQFTLMKVPGTLAIPTGDEGGAMTDGVDHAGTIDLGDLDPWTFSATAGESLTIDLVETNDISEFVPWIRLVSPTGSLVAGDFDGVAAQVSVTSAPETGTYTVIIGTNDSGRDGVGEYLVTLSR
ncbi:MAG: Ig-like domain-containing protein, partial [Halobacteriales archaeon]|nr:Ig-like domain-containing protein [Halobacteriales archaeon]